MDHVVLVRCDGSVIIISRAMPEEAALRTKREFESEMSHVPDRSLHAEVMAMTMADNGHELARSAMERADI